MGQNTTLDSAPAPKRPYRYSAFTLPQLKIIQEAVTLLVFTGFTILVMHEKPRPNDYFAMLLIFLAVLVSFAGKK